MGVPRHCVPHVPWVHIHCSRAPQSKLLACRCSQLELHPDHHAKVLRVILRSTFAPLPAAGADVCHEAEICNLPPAPRPSTSIPSHVSPCRPSAHTHTFALGGALQV